METNELRESGEKRESFPLSEGLVNPVSREVTGRISGRERHGQLRKIDDGGERGRERESLVAIIRAKVYHVYQQKFDRFLFIASHPDSQLCRRLSLPTTLSSVHICFATLSRKEKREK